MTVINKQRFVHTERKIIDNIQTKNIDCSVENIVYVKQVNILSLNVIV